MENKNNTENINQAAAALVAALTAGNAPALDVAAVEKIAGDVMARKFGAVLPGLLEQVKKAAESAAASAGVRRVEVTATDGTPPKDLGVQHEKFPLLLKLCQVRGLSGHVAPVYLYGPPGTGKTTAAANVAKALNLPFYYNGAISSAFELSGFIDAAGHYQETQFYKAYSGGGVYLFDELDSSSPAAVLAFNAALANGHAAFPVGNVARHKDCIILAGGNTCMRGDGAGAGFQRVKHDAAFRDRFVFLEWQQDEKLELAVASAFGDVGREWCKHVQKLRAAAVRIGVKDFEITSRATFNGAAMLAAGVDRDVVDAATIRKGLTSELWAKIVKGA